MIQQLLIAFIFVIFTLGFFLIWMQNRAFKSAAIFAASYGCAGIAFGFEALFTIEQSYLFFTPMSDTLYMAGGLLLSVGLSVRFNQKPATLILALVFIATLLPTQWYWFVEDDFKLRTEIISYGCAAMIAVGAVSIFSKVKSLAEKALFYLVLGFSIQFVIITVITLRVQKEALNTNNFIDSMYLELLHFSVAIFAIAIAVLLFTNLAISVISEIQKLSDSDSLTKLHNRKSFENQTLEAINEHQNRGLQMALVVCDIDYFKSINDMYGHANGDQVLLRFVDCLKECRRDADILGRVGGDEFTILLPKANIEMARLMAEYARAKFNQECVGKDDNINHLSASFGVAEMKKDDTYRSLFERADKVLYEAKQSGRNKVVADVDNLPPAKNAAYINTI